MWKIDRRTGLPDTAKPKWSYDQPNVDFWHSATFSWDGKVANFIDESFGDGCPTTDEKTGGCPARPKVRDGQHVLLRDRAAASCCRSTATRGRRTTTSSPTTGKYCSSHLGIPVPARDRYLLVNAYYRGGSSVIDFSDPTKPKEIAYADWTARTRGRRTPTRAGTGAERQIPVYSNDGLSRNYGTAAAPATTRRPRTASCASGAESGGRTWSASIASTRSCRSG